MYPLRPLLMTVTHEAGSGEDDLMPILLKQCSHSLISNHTLISLLAVLSVFSHSPAAAQFHPWHLVSLITIRSSASNPYPMPTGHCHCTKPSTLVYVYYSCALAVMYGGNGLDMDYN